MGKRHLNHRATVKSKGKCLIRRTTLVKWKSNCSITGQRLYSRATENHRGTVKPFGNGQFVGKRLNS